MSLFSNAPFSKITTYRKDYVPRDCKRPIKAHPVSEYDNPITGPFEEHLLPFFKYKKLPRGQTKYPCPIRYARELAEKYPPTRNFLRDPPRGPPNMEVIDKLYENDNRSTYMISYCVLGDYDSEQKRLVTSRSLPTDWVIPLTTQRCHYRPLSVTCPEGLARLEFKHPKDNLVPNEKERAILEVKTGESIYASDISSTGMDIIKGKLHGDVNIRPKFDPEELLKAKLIRTK